MSERDDAMPSRDESGEGEGMWGNSDPFHLCYYIERPPPPNQEIEWGGVCGNCVLMAIALAKQEPGRLVSLMRWKEVPIINVLHEYKEELYRSGLSDYHKRGLMALLATSPPLPEPPAPKREGIDGVSIPTIDSRGYAKWPSASQFDLKAYTDAMIKGELYPPTITPQMYRDMLKPRPPAPPFL